MRLDTTNRAALLAQLKQLREQLITLDDEIASDEKLLTDTLDGETEALELLRVVVRQALDAETFEEALKHRREELETRAARFKARAARCRNFVSEAMQTLQIKALAAEDFTASVRDGKPSVRITDAAALPEQFMRIKFEPMKIEIGDALKAGATIAGAELSNAGPVLTIRKA